MKKIISALLVLVTFTVCAQDQKYFTKKGNISFYSDAPMEKIEAHNRRVTSVIDLASGAIEFSVLIRSFEFEKALMQEHFNENYMESGKFPKSTFKGNITNLKEIDFTKDGEYKANVEGKLTMHGVTKEVKTSATFTVKGGVISAKAEFEVALKDYDIKVPSMVVKNIAEVIKVVVDIKEYEIYKTSKK